MRLELGALLSNLQNNMHPTHNIKAKARETELREKWNVEAYSKGILGCPDADVKGIADFWLKEISLALEEKVRALEDYKKQLRNKVCDKKYDREIDMEIMGIDRAIKILKQ